MHTCDPNALVILSIILGSLIAAELILILSAPASSNLSTSSKELMPPPTANGILISIAILDTSLVNVFRPSTVAVISKKTNSSAPSVL